MITITLNLCLSNAPTDFEKSPAPMRSKSEVDAIRKAERPRAVELAQNRNWRRKDLRVRDEEA